MVAGCQAGGLGHLLQCMRKYNAESPKQGRKRFNSIVKTIGFDHLVIIYLWHWLFTVNTISAVQVRIVMSGDYALKAGVASSTIGWWSSYNFESFYVILLVNLWFLIKKLTSVQGSIRFDFGIHVRQCLILCRCFQLTLLLSDPCESLLN